MANIVVLGATSGIAKALLSTLAKDAHHLILAGRDIVELSRLENDLRVRFNVRSKPIQFHALEYASHQSFFDQCRDYLGSIDGVVLVYGYLGHQRRAETDFEEVQKIIHTNYTSCVSILNFFADYFEKRKAGFICAISSVAGDRGRQSNYMYGSAKGALSLCLQGLRNRLSSSGVHVLTVKPGFVDTKMTFGQHGMFLVAKPEKVANDIYRAILKSKNTLYTPFFWKWIMFIIISIPEAIFKKLKL